MPRDELQDEETFEDDFAARAATISRAAHGAANDKEAQPPPRPILPAAISELLVRRSSRRERRASRPDSAACAFDRT